MHKDTRIIDLSAAKELTTAYKLIRWKTVIIQRVWVDSRWRTNDLIGF